MIKAATRFEALDVLRGMTVCFMIIVNDPGGDPTFWPLDHAKWFGFTPTDLVFPTFLFVVGNAMSFSMKKYETSGTRVFLTRVFRRAFVIFLTGYLIYWFPFFHFDDNGHLALNPLGETRILGVLQRIALCYLFAALIIHFFNVRGAIIFSVLALLLYWLLAYAFGDKNDPYSLTGNAGLKLDLWVMGDKHLYHGEGIPFDPEGILSTLPSIVNVIAGYLAGVYLFKKGPTYETIAKFLLAGCTLIFLSLCWNMAFPIGKKLWTSPFVLTTVGLDLLLLSALIFIIEISGKTKWTYFFGVFGRNPLFIYIISELLAILTYIINIGNESVHDWFYNRIFHPVFGDYAGSLAYALSFMLVCWLIGWILDRRKIYIRV